MESVLDFIGAAMLWIAIGLLLAILFVRNAGKKKNEEYTDNYGTEGMSIGMCFGTAIGSTFLDNTGIGISFGMLIGLAIGTSIKKKKEEDDEIDKEDEGDEKEI